MFGYLILYIGRRVISKIFDHDQNKKYVLYQNPVTTYKQKFQA